MLAADSTAALCPSLKLYIKLRIVFILLSTSFPIPDKG